MLSSYRKALVYIAQQFLQREFDDRIIRIQKTALNQGWFNAAAFKIAVKELLED